MDGRKARKFLEFFSGLMLEATLSRLRLVAVAMPLREVDREAAHVGVPGVRFLSDQARIF